MNNELLIIIEELFKLNETGVYTTCFSYSHISHWFYIDIYKGKVTTKLDAFFSDAIMIKSRKWFSVWQQEAKNNNFNKPDKLELSPFIEYLLQLRTARHPVLIFDPAKSAKHDAPVL